jgi:abortive infection bacteriophage resistance protein
MECLSFGKTNTLLRYINRKRDSKAICEVFGYHPTVMKSTMEVLRYTRNLCAHHARLWNRWFVYAPKHAHAFGTLECPPRTFYELAFVMTKLQQAISPHTAWKDHLFKLFEEHPSIPFYRMGFQQDWQNDPFWEKLETNIPQISHTVVNS